MDVLFNFQNTIYGSGDVKTAVTAREDIGLFVERIISDPRTLNRYVFIWAAEVTQNEAFALAERISKKQFTPLHMSREEVETRNAEAKEANDWLGKAAMQYALNIWIRGDNTIENAKKEEYGFALDARELYPEIKPKQLEECARELYAYLA